MPGSATSSLGWFNHHYHGEELNVHSGTSGRGGFGPFVESIPRCNFGYVVMGNDPFGLNSFSSSSLFPSLPARLFPYPLLSPSYFLG